MSSAYLNVEVGVAYGVSYDLESSACREHSEGRSKGYLAAGSKTGSNAHHVSLCDTAVKETLGELLLEYARLGSGSEVSVEYHEIFIFITKLGKRVAVALSSCDLLYISHCNTPFLSLSHDHASRAASAASSSPLACSYCSALGAVPCHDTLSSMKETPLPLMLF